MTENEALQQMIPPNGPRPTKWRGGVIQVIVTRACNLVCFGCTQGSNLRGKTTFMSPEHFEQALKSLAGYGGVVGTFGGNPAVSPHFVAYCELLRKHVPFEQRGLWCNDPMREEYGREMRATFNPAYSNLNCHLSKDAFARFKAWWPESMPFGADRDSRHSPPFVAMKDIVHDEGERWRLISNCDLNIFWSSAITVFRGQLRAYFCEVAGSQAILHQDEPDYPDTGVAIDREGLTVVPGRGYPLAVRWWELPMVSFREQVRKHCHECGIPLRGYGQLAQADDTHAEQVSETHRNVYRPKRVGRAVELVTVREQLHEGRIDKVTKYLQNAAK